MKKILAVVAILFASHFAYADLTINNVYIPQAPPGSMTFAAYLSITNNGSEPRTVVGVSSPAFGVSHLHHTMVKEGMASMKAIDALMIQPGETVTLEPGARHIMLMKPVDDALAAGVVSLMLQFKNGENIEVTASVRVLN